MNPAHDGADPEHVAHYETSTPWECLAYSALARSQRRYADAYKDEAVELQ